MNFVQWSFETRLDTRTIVFPDGCRDIIVVERADAGPTVLLTTWDYLARSVAVPCGSRLTGFRLRPGAALDCSVLADCPPEPDRVAAFLQTGLHIDSELTDLVDVLAGAPSVELAAKRVGVRTRTLQRRLRAAGVPPPDFWRLLGRARRAAAESASHPRLAEIAASCGYSDQAHMTREFVRWFGATPRQLLRQPKALAELCQPGLGNWTGEHNSTR